MEAYTRMAQRDRTDVLASAAAGDEIAFRRLITEHHDDMRRVSAYISGDIALAEEATHAAWVIAWKRLRDVREPSHLRPWLITVAANEAKKLLRKRRTRARFEIATDFAAKHGIKAEGFNIGGTMHDGDVTMHMVLAVHSSVTAEGMGGRLPSAIMKISRSWPGSAVNST